MLEPSGGIRRGDRRDGLPYRLQQGLAGTGAQPTQDGLDLGEGLLEAVSEKSGM